MSSANKRRGSQFEIDLLKYLRSEWSLDAERLRLAGTKDEGDIVLKVGGIPYILEAKNTQKIDLARFVSEATAEADNYAVARGIRQPGFAAVVKRRQHSIADSYVVMPLDEWLHQIVTED